MFIIKALTHCSESPSPVEHPTCYRSRALRSSALSSDVLLCTADRRPALQFSYLNAHCSLHRISRSKLHSKTRAKVLQRMQQKFGDQLGIILLQVRPLPAGIHGTCL